MCYGRRINGYRDMDVYGVLGRNKRVSERRNEAKECVGAVEKDENHVLWSFERTECGVFEGAFLLLLHLFLVFVFLPFTLFLHYTYMFH